MALDLVLLAHVEDLVANDLAELAGGLVDCRAHRYRAEAQEARQHPRIHLIGLQAGLRDHPVLVRVGQRDLGTRRLCRFVDVEPDVTRLEDHML